MCWALQTKILLYAGTTSLDAVVSGFFSSVVAKSNADEVDSQKTASLEQVS